MLANSGGDPNRCLVYLAAAATEARVLLAAQLPSTEWTRYPSYKNQNLNSDKYKFRVQRAPLFTRDSFKETMQFFCSTDSTDVMSSLTQLYIACRGHISAFKDKAKATVVRMGDIFSQLRSPEHSFTVVMRAFWRALITSNPTLVHDFQKDPFKFEKARVLKMRRMTSHRPLSPSYQKRQAPF